MSETTTIRVCTDCLYVLANGVEDDAQAAAADRMATIWQGYHLTIGRMFDDCGRDCQEDAEAHAENCESYGFSWSSCDGCESHLGGDRHYVTAWKEDVTAA